MYLFCLNLFYFMFMVVLLEGGRERERECVRVCVCMPHVCLVSLHVTYQVADGQGLDSQTVMNHHGSARTRTQSSGKTSSTLN